MSGSTWGHLLFEAASVVMWLSVSISSSWTLGGPCSHRSALFYLSLHSKTRILLFISLGEDLWLNFLMLADTLTCGLSTERRVWIYFPVENEGDQCGAQVRSSLTTEPPSIPPLITLKWTEGRISRDALIIAIFQAEINVKWVFHEKKL